MLPPYQRLISIIISSKDRSLSLQGAREIKLRLNQIDNIEVLGPVDSPLLKIKKNFRSRLLIRLKNQNWQLDQVIFLWYDLIIISR